MTGTPHPHPAHPLPDNRNRNATPEKPYVEPINFLRIGEDIIRVDMIVRIKECRDDETLYGKSVRKTNDKLGWLELHFLSGEVMKIDGAGSVLLRRYLMDEHRVWDLVGDE